MMSNFSPVLRNRRQRLRDVLGFHEAEAQFEHAEKRSEMLLAVTRSSCGTRGLLMRPDRQDDVLCMQDVIVLEIVQQRRGRRFRIAGQEDRRTRAPRPARARSCARST